MMRRFTALVAMIGASASIFAAQPTDMDGAKTANGKVVVDFIETLFNRHLGEQAFDKYVSKDYVDHGYLGAGAAAQNTRSDMRQGSDMGQGMSSTAPPASNKQSGFERSRSAEAAMVANSQIHMEVKKVLVQGDLVFVQAHGTNGQSPNGDLMWVLYRVKDGKIVEHWDTHNEIPANQVGKQW
ncbi:MAG: nuclear transport factor 2 family protein [Steroidobacteraceae bacterium]